MTHARLSQHACLIAGLLLAAAAAADVVTLSDGSRLVGTVRQLAEGKLKLETTYAGALELDMTLVTSIEVDGKIIVETAAGDRLVGSVQWDATAEKAVVQTQVGDVPVPLAQVYQIWPEGQRSPAEIALQLQLEELRESMTPKWGASFEAGLLYREGNKELFRASGRGELRRKTAKDLLRFYLSAAYSEEDKQRNESEVIGGAYYEYLLTERWFAYGTTEFEYDEFENLDLRASFAVGAGYYWIKREEHELKTRAGIGFLHESYRDGVTNNTAQAELGLDYRYDIKPWLRFTHSTTYYPTFEELRDYRIVSDSAFIIPLADSEVWKLKLGAKYEYDPLPQPGFERLDQTYYANLLLEVN